MRVRMLTEICGTPAYHTGQIIDLEDRVATAWIEDGLAVSVGPEEVERAAHNVRETR